MPVSKIIDHDMKEGSWIRKMFEQGIEMKRVGREVFDLSLGNPELPPPPAFHAALYQLIAAPSAGMHRYMPNAGYAETRTAIAQLINRDSTVTLSASDIVMSCGVAGGLNVVFHALFNPGDEIIIFAPYFPEYRHYIKSHQLVCRVVETDDDFLPNVDTLLSQINPRTRAVLINSPNNPTGAVYNADVIQSLANVLTAKGKEYGIGLLLILDDAYHKLVYDNMHTPCIFDFYSQSIVVASFSKTLSIPGERLGYIAVYPECEDHQQVMDALTFCTRTLGFVNAPALMQHVIRKLPTAMVDIADYQRKRDFLYGQLIAIGYETRKPDGAFYIFPRTPCADDVLFIESLAKTGVLAVPGSGFGRKGYMRLSYSVPDAVLTGAVVGLQQAFHACKKS